MPDSSAGPCERWLQLRFCETAITSPSRPAPTLVSRGRPPLSGISLRQLRALLAVAEEGSLARAASRLHLSASALSMLIRGLETELEVRLFDRTTRRMKLTQAGQMLLPVVTRAFTELDEVIDAVRQREAERSGRLTIATSPLLAATWLPRQMAAFGERYPAVRIQLLDMPVSEVAQAVRQGHADGGLCTLDAATDLGGLVSRVVLRDRLMACCAPGHGLASRTEIGWRELVGQPLVLLRHGSGLRTLVEQTFAAMDELLIPAAEVSHVTTAIGLVEAGLGVALLPRLALSHRWAQTIAAVALTDPVVTRDIVLLTANDRLLPDAVSNLLNEFVTGLSE